MQFTQKNIQLANQIVEKAINNKTILVTAESCTGGLISSHLTAIPGSSKVFTCSFITYSDNSKIQLLGVNKNTIEENGAVSAKVALEMASGGLVKSSASIALSVTGIAGPDGGSITKPVGLVYIGLATSDGTRLTEEKRFLGGRDKIRDLTVHAGLVLISRYLN